MMSQQMIERKRCIDIFNAYLAEIESAKLQDHPLYRVLKDIMQAIHSGKSIKAVGNVDLGESQALKDLNRLASRWE